MNMEEFLANEEREIENKRKDVSCIEKEVPEKWRSLDFFLCTVDSDSSTESSNEDSEF